MLVGAVLAPKRADDPELGERRLTAEHVEETLVLAEGQPVLGDERGGDLWVAWAGGNGHGVRVAGVLEGAGAIVGGFEGIDGRASFGVSGGVMRVVPVLERVGGSFAPPRSAASFSEIGMGELLVPV